MFLWRLEYLSLRRKDSEGLINNVQLAINNSITENVIAINTYQFDIQIINLRKELNSKKEFVLSRQILKSGTSIGANVEEAIGGISKKDFRAKMSISYKEARETHYWLRLLRDTDYISKDKFDNLRSLLDEILKILFKIVESSKN
ncbi:MAG: four helix bundle protein [Ulvibacter sp.]|jgi:four helix bundle protein